MWAMGKISFSRENEFEFDLKKEIFSLVDKLPIIGKVPDTTCYDTVYKSSLHGHRQQPKILKTVAHRQMYLVSLVLNSALFQISVENDGCISISLHTYSK